MKQCTILLVLIGLCCLAAKRGHYLSGFSLNPYGEQRMEMQSLLPDVRVVVNAPSPEEFDVDKKTAVVVYALPNGNSIEWTAGKRMEEGDDWHYNIQNIGAQMRFVRKLNKEYNWVVAYLQSSQKSWPAWSKEHGAAGKRLVQQVVDTLRATFASYKPAIMLSGHSGGGRFIFDYITGVEAIPNNVERITFLDSSYGYADSLHLQKLVSWLKESNKHYLSVIAYNDSVVVYNGKPIVSPTGGTWYRSRAMQRDLASFFDFESCADTAMVYHSALNGRVTLRLKENPNGLIYHTLLVERNGLIFSLLSGTEYESKGYSFWGTRAYNSYQTVHTDY